MASRVNIKFAIALAAGVFIVGAAAIAIAFIAINKTGEEYVERGDAALARGDIQLAADNYEDAVGHDRTRIDWLEKWRSTLIQLTPETQSEYERSFSKHYLGILEQMAVIEWDNPERQRTFIEARFNQVDKLGGSNVAAWQSIADMTKQRVERLDQSDPAAKSLRRYRGLAIVNQMALTEVDPLVRDEGLADLRTALEGDPTDDEVGRAIIIWHAVRWRREFLNRRTIDARRLEQALANEIEAMRELLPNSPRIELAVLESRLDRIAAENSEEAAQRAAFRDLAGEEERAVQAFMTSPPSSFDGRDLMRLSSMLARISVPNRLETMLAIIDRVEVTDSTTDPRLIVLHADILGGLGRYDEAIAMIQDYLAQPVRPLSLEGLVQRYFRPQALERLADHALAKWEGVETESEREAALAVAKDAQRQLNETTQGGERSPQALTVAAKLAVAEGRNAEAVRLFTELVERAGQNDPDTRWRLAQALRAADQLGAARAQLRMILDVDPANLRALLSLTDIHARLKEDAQARAVLANIKQLYPHMPEIEEIERRLDRMLTVNPEREATRTRIAQARAVRSDQSESGLQRAREILTVALEEDPENIAYTIELVDVETTSGQIAEARRLLTRALTFHPGNVRLIRLRRALQSDDPFAAALSVIDEADIPVVEKLIRQYRFAKGQGRDEVAEDYLARLKAEHADNPIVMEVLFSNALSQRDTDEVRRLVDRAVATNADQVNGLLFQARLELLEEDFEAAARTLRQAKEILPFNSRILLMLGQTELRLGNVSDGLRALASAYDASPDNGLIAMRYISTLRELQRDEDALEVARSASRLNPLNLDLINAWLELEDLVGDTEVALTERQRIHSVFPSNKNNSLALAGLLIKSEQWEEAESLLEELESEGANDATMLTRARLFALRDGVDAGQRVINDYVAQRGENANSAMMQIALANFLFGFGEEEKAVDVLLAARELQSAENMEVDRQLGDYAFNSGDYETALTHYEAVHETISSEDSRVALRLAETYTKLERFDEAESLLASIESDDDLTAVLIRARGLAARGSRAAARALFDRAVEMAPNNPNPFLQRAEFNSADASQFNDALADVDQAIRLQPDLVVARRMKAEMLASRGRASEAISEIRRAVQAAPENDDLRTLLVQLHVSVNDYPSAISVADRTIDERGEDNLQWVRISGDLNARFAELRTVSDPERAAEHWKAAADRYEMLYDVNKDDSAKLRLANARLLQKTPDAQQALDLIEAMTEESLARGEIAILRARALYATGRRTEAAVAAREALERVENYGQLRVWFAQLEQMFGSELETGRFAENLTAPDGLEPSFEVRLISSLSGDPERQSELLQRLNALDGQLVESVDFILYYRQLGRIQFQSGNYDEAEKAFLGGLEHAPEDLEFNNNLAYVRSEFLGDFEGAIEPARTAANAAPQNANILDTLGWVYFNAGRLQEAQQALQSARQYATSPVEYIAIEMHLSEVFLAKDDRAQAVRLYQSARDRLSDAPGLTSLYGEDLESLRERLDQAE